MFDLLSHQRRTPSSTPSVKSTNGGADEDEWSLVDTNSNSGNGGNNNAYLINHLHMSTDLSEEQIRQVVNALTSTNKTLEVGAQSAGIGLPVVNYPQMGFAFSTCFLLGSPLALFLVARGVERLSSDFHLPTCQRCVNIFHPFDPVAYRLENLVMPEYRVSHLFHLPVFRTFVGERSFMVVALWRVIYLRFEFYLDSCR